MITPCYTRATFKVHNTQTRTYPKNGEDFLFFDGDDCLNVAKAALCPCGAVCGLDICTVITFTNPVLLHTMPFVPGNVQPPHLTEDWGYICHECAARRK